MSIASQSTSGPAWDIARLFPDEGKWADTDYLFLSRATNRLAEFSDGRVEVLVMPTKSHQRMVLFLYNLLLAFVGQRRMGEVLVAPYPVRLREGKFREPDVLFVLAEHKDRMREEYAEGADLVMEVVSEENRSHDLVTKRHEYAAAGIPEYWIVDPGERKVTVLTLQAGNYEVHVEASPGGKADSALLPGFTVEVDGVFHAATRE